MEMELVGEAEELMEQYVSGVNCAPTTAREEMIAVKKRFGKGGRNCCVSWLPVFCTGRM